MRQAPPFPHNTRGIRHHQATEQKEGAQRHGIVDTISSVIVLVFFV